MMMIARSAILAGLAAALLLAWPPASAVAIGAEPESWGYDLSHDLMSPFCPGRTLATCPSPQASELVQWIVMQEAAGASREQVVEMLIERYGEEILGAPPAKGITLWAYVFPVLGFLVGGGLAFVVLRRIVASGPAVDGSGTLAGASVPTAGSSSAPTDAPGGHDGSERRETSPSGAAQPEDEEDDLARIVDADLDRRSA
jgi:cytochrome c-type biogenesis protein CcmH/NrfF